MSKIDKENKYIDINYADAIEEYGDEIVELAYEVFINETYDELKEKIPKAYNKRDYQEIKSHIHKFKTTSKYLGAEEFSDLCNKIQLCCKEGKENYSLLDELYPIFIENLGKLYEVCKTEYQKRKNIDPNNLDEDEKDHKNTAESEYENKSENDEIINEKENIIDGESGFGSFDDAKSISSFKRTKTLKPGTLRSGSEFEAFTDDHKTKVTTSPSFDKILLSIESISPQFQSNSLSPMFSISGSSLPCFKEDSDIILNYDRIVNGVNEEMINHSIFSFISEYSKLKKEISEAIASKFPVRLIYIIQNIEKKFQLLLSDAVKNSLSNIVSELATQSFESLSKNFFEIMNANIENIHNQLKEVYEVKIKKKIDSVKEKPRGLSFSNTEKQLKISNGNLPSPSYTDEPAEKKISKRNLFNLKKGAPIYTIENQIDKEEFSSKIFEYGEQIRKAIESQDKGELLLSLEDFQKFAKKNKFYSLPLVIEDWKNQILTIPLETLNISYEDIKEIMAQMIEAVEQKKISNRRKTMIEPTIQVIEEAEKIIDGDILCELTPINIADFFRINIMQNFEIVDVEDENGDHSGFQRRSFKKRNGGLKKDDEDDFFFPYEIERYPCSVF